MARQPSHNPKKALEPQSPDLPLVESQEHLSVTISRNITVTSRESTAGITVSHDDDSHLCILQEESCMEPTPTTYAIHVMDDY